MKREQLAHGRAHKKLLLPWMDYPQADLIDAWQYDAPHELVVVVRAGKRCVMISKYHNRFSIKDGDAVWFAYSTDVIAGRLKINIPWLDGVLDAARFARNKDRPPSPYRGKCYIEDNYEVLITKYADRKCYTMYKRSLSSGYRSSFRTTASVTRRGALEVAEQWKRVLDGAASEASLNQMIESNKHRLSKNTRDIRNRLRLQSDLSDLKSQLSAIQNGGVRGQHHQ